MSLFTIADLHLSTFAKTDKSMEVFGHAWDDYMNRLKTNWEKLVSPSDTVVIPGDISWALSLEEAKSDLLFLDALPGQKILLKGNHDFWWTSMVKHKKFFEENGITTVSFLYHDAVACGDFILAGTRGWYNDRSAQNAPAGVDFEKLTNRENLRLSESLKAAKALKEANPEKEILVFLHFPPVYLDKCSEGIVSLIEDYGIKRVFYGHLHGNYGLPKVIEKNGVRYEIVAADHLSFIPKHIPTEQ